MSFKSLLLRAIRSNSVAERAMERALFVQRIERSAFMKERARIARQFLTGEGIEIGALQLPLPLPKSARVRYVDRFDAETARRTFLYLAKHKMVDVDIIDDGEVLSSIAPESLDFIVANHMIEHCHNPLATIENWLQKLKSEGVIFLAVPDMAHTFDRHRTPTTAEHLLGEWRGGPINNEELFQHYVEWSRDACDIEEEGEIRNHATKLMERNDSIHFHAWRLSHFVDALLKFERELRAKGAGFCLEFCGNNHEEFVVVLRKCS